MDTKKYTGWTRGTLVLDQNPNASCPVTSIVTQSKRNESLSAGRFVCYGDLGSNRTDEIQSVRSRSQFQKLIGHKRVLSGGRITHGSDKTFDVLFVPSIAQFYCKKKNAEERRLLAYCNSPSEGRSSIRELSGSRYARFNLEGKIVIGHLGT